MTNVAKFYNDVIDDVINGMKEEFVDDGLDTQILVQLQKLWRAKVADTHVLDTEPVTNTAAHYAGIVQRSQPHIRSFVPTSTGVRQLTTSTGPIISSQIATTKPILTVQPATVTGLTAQQGQFPLLQQRRVSTGPPQCLPLRAGVNLNQTAVAPVGGAVGISTTSASLPQSNNANLLQQQSQLHPGSNFRLPANAIVRPTPIGIGVGSGGNLTMPLQNTVTTTTNLGQIQSHLLQTNPLTNTHQAPQFATLPSGITGQLVQIGQQTYLVPQTMINLRHPQPGAGLTALAGTRQTIASTGHQLSLGPQHQSLQQQLHQQQQLVTGTHLLDPNLFNRSQVDGGHDDDDEVDSEIESFTPAVDASRIPCATGSTSSTPRRQRSGTGGLLGGSSIGGGQGASDTDEDDDDLVPATPGLTPCHATPRHLGSRSSVHPLTPGALNSPMTPLSVGGSVTGGLSESRPQGSTGGSIANGSRSAARQVNQNRGLAVSQVGATGRQTSSGSTNQRVGKRRFVSSFSARNNAGSNCRDEFEDDDDEGSECCDEEAEIMTTTTMTPAERGPCLGEDDDDDDDDDDDASFIGVATPGTPRNKLSGKRMKNEPSTRSTSKPVMPSIGLNRVSGLIAPKGSPSSCAGQSYASASGLASGASSSAANIASSQRQRRAPQPPRKRRSNNYVRDSVHDDDDDDDDDDEDDLIDEDAKSTHKAEDDILPPVPGTPDSPDPGLETSTVEGNVGVDDDDEEQEDEAPLNSGDDVSDEEPEKLFESDNVVVCQYDKIHRSRNRWRLHLKDGIMAIHGRDFVFQKATGEAEW